LAEEISPIPTVLAASVFHDGVYTIDEVKAAMARDGVPVRR
jgi:imidazole glycerol phosphate synthase subunit HisF